jgi:Ribonuclease G/E
VKPEPPAVPEETPAAAVEPARSGPETVLQTTPPERQAELERTIRSLLQRAWSDLNRVDYQRLSTDAKAQYDQAKQFATQGDEALQKRNLPFAYNLADKAANIAGQLAGR